MNDNQTEYNQEKEYSDMENQEQESTNFFPNQMGRISFYSIQIGTISVIALLSAATIQSINYYTFHVLCMGLFAILLFFSASLLQQAQSSNKSQLFSLHWKVNTAAIISATIGVACIFWLKFSNGKVALSDHFNSSHSQWGLASIIMSLSAASFGAVLKFKPALLGLSLLNARKLFIGHRIFGYAISVSVSCTLYFAILHEFNKSRLSMGWTVFSITVLCITQLLLLTRISFKNLYMKTK